MIKEPTFEAMPQNVARLEEKVDALTETVNKLSQHIFSLKASAKDEEMICGGGRGGWGGTWEGRGGVDTGGRG